jgi:hypothetical protein
MKGTLPDQPRVVLYRRPSPGHVAGSRQRAIQQRLERFEEADTVGAVEVETWPKALPTGSTDHPEARDAFTEVKQWARREGARNELLDIEVEPAHLLPVTALFVYDDDELAAVYPHTDDEGPRSVPDALRTLDELVDGPDASADADDLLKAAD